MIFTRKPLETPFHVPESRVIAGYQLGLHPRNNASSVHAYRVKHSLFQREELLADSSSKDFFVEKNRSQCDIQWQTSLFGKARSDSADVPDVNRFCWKGFWISYGDRDGIRWKRILKENSYLEIFVTKLRGVRKVRSWTNDEINTAFYRQSGIVTEVRAVGASANRTSTVWQEWTHSVRLGLDRNW